ncbi:MAG: DUF4911 domain-containing protein [Synergistaceae bacterium]|jgi:hypothetical protein|nr:DUF4911 domain-containing protein [Synergistaceae bacterium]
MALMTRCSLKAPKEEIFYMSWTIDAYDGVAFLSNEKEPGIVSIIYSSDYASDVESIIDAFVSEGISIERLGTEVELESN